MTTPSEDAPETTDHTPRSHPLDVDAGHMSLDKPLGAVKLLLRSGHTVTADLDEDTVKELMTKFAQAWETENLRMRGYIQLPIGLVSSTEVIGIVGGEQREDVG